ncbi:hypothetical protein AAHA92_05004 [Salvia divinorum]|uniref:Uncharacterized protein n=1 Tax=Salvia divinorum TaxID=28513 RepID=A0ABD1I124_SALDI
MGCCLSAGNHNQEAENRRGIIQVETVKEVLLETTVAPEPQAENFKPMSQEWKTEVRKPPTIARKYGENASEIKPSAAVESLPAAPVIKPSVAVDNGVVDPRPPLPRKRRVNGRGRVAARRVAAPQPEKRGQVASLRPVRGEEVAPPRKECDQKSAAVGDAETLENPFVSLECFIFL